MDRFRWRAGARPELSSPRTAIRLFAAGIPCTGASKAGRSKNALVHAEEHPDVGYLFLPTLHYVRLHRPELVVFENTNTYKSTLSAKLIRDALTASGYTFEERVVNPLKEFSTPSQRKRWILVASRIGRFSWLSKPKPSPAPSPNTSILPRPKTRRTAPPRAGSRRREVQCPQSGRGLRFRHVADR